jgi:general stress protein 26
MAEVKNLSNKEGIEKIQELAKNETCLFCTFEEDCRLNTRPMSTQDVDDEGQVWFFSRYDSDKNMQIDDNHKVQLLYSNPGKQHYLSIEGEANILRDRNKTDEIWNPIAKAWFTEGKNDPSLTLIKVRPRQIHYWETKDGKMVSFLKIFTAALTGKTMDGGVEGAIKV